MRKKLFAILMSAMMMVTFMPAMAFAAASDFSVASDYSTVTYKGVTYKTVQAREYDTADTTTWTGRILVKADVTGVESPAAELTGWVAAYHPLDGAVVKETTSGKSLLYDSFVAPADQATLNSWFGTDATVPVRLRLTTSEKGWVLNSAANTHQIANTLTWGEDATAVTKTWDGIPYDYTVVMGTPTYDFNNEYTAQSFTLPVSVTPGQNAAPVVGSVASKALTFQAKAVKAATSVNAGDYLLDGKAFANLNYDGAEHAISLKNLPGITATYELWNVAAGKWEAVANPTVKEAGTYQFRAIASDAKVKQTTPVALTTIYVFGYDHADATLTAGIGFKGTAPVVYAVEPGFKAVDYVVFDNTSTTNKKAIKANEALLKDYFNDFYTITEETTGATVKATIAKKDQTTVLNKLTAAERDALVAKYGALYNNFMGTAATRTNIVIPMFNINTATATFNVANDIVWEKAPLTKTFKYKNLKKKEKTFTVKAVALTPVTYKVSNGGSQIKIDKKTGKVTVKKGLKKGTYNVYVSAKANGADTNTYVLKIKVK